VKNISLTLQALYQSKEKSKLSALSAGLRTAQALRDDPSLCQVIKAKFPGNPELGMSFIALGTYASFYNRASLANVMQKHLQTEAKGRDRAYLISALSLTNSTEKLDFLRTYLPNFRPTENEPESLALEPFLKAMDRTQGKDFSALRTVLNTKTIKRLGKRVQEYATPEKWYKKHLKKKKKR
jgi:hypothetical protein